MFIKKMNNHEDDHIENVQPEQPVKKKRGRKPKNYYENLKKQQELNPEPPKEPPVPKKRGRKPKGGKIIENTDVINTNNYVKKNIILHLKCTSDDIINSEEFSGNVSNNLTLDINNNNKKGELNYHVYDEKVENISINTFDTNKQNIIVENNNIDINKKDNEDNDTNIKVINKKLKELQEHLHNNSSPNNKSACFWCTCDFDNPAVQIPKFKLKDTYHCYGCFCSPECGVSFLMNESIDTSAKFERYHLMNFIYCKIYNYTKNIKPAPNPFYMLDKFCGNLTIQEYRKCLKNDRLFMIIDKPLTKILPELHEENNDFIINKETISSSSSYQIKRKSTKPSSKSDILNSNFGMNS